MTAEMGLATTAAIIGKILTVLFQVATGFVWFAVFE